MEYFFRVALIEPRTLDPESPAAEIISQMPPSYRIDLVNLYYDQGSEDDFMDSVLDLMFIVSEYTEMPPANDWENPMFDIFDDLKVNINPPPHLLIPQLKNLAHGIKR